MNFSELSPKAQELCEKCQCQTKTDGLVCPYINLDGDFCQAIKTISSHEKSLSQAIRNLVLGGCYKNGGLPYRIKPESN